MYIPHEDGQQGPKHVAAKNINIYNKHLEKLLRLTALLTTLLGECIFQAARY
jgi:hypothetical protein